jgi:hypothetical protein
MPVTDKDGTQYIVIVPPTDLPDELIERIRRLKNEKLGPAPTTERTTTATQPK